MAFPYKVTVRSKGSDINIQVDPQPIASKPEYAEHVTRRMTEVIRDNSIQSNTFMNRAIFKHQITSVLQQLHAQRMIVPMVKKEKDERNAP